MIPRSLSNIECLMAVTISHMIWLTEHCSQSQVIVTFGNGLLIILMPLHLDITYLRRTMNIYQDGTISCVRIHLFHLMAGINIFLSRCKNFYGLIYFDSFAMSHTPIPMICNRKSAFTTRGYIQSHLKWYPIIQRAIIKLSRYVDNGRQVSTLATAMAGEKKFIWVPEVMCSKAKSNSNTHIHIHTRL